MQQWTYAPLEADQVPDQLGHNPIQAEQAYISIFLRSMRVVNVRTALKKFYGTVHSYISLPYLSLGSRAQFHVLITPSNLKDVDASHIDRVISVNRRLLGPVPYRGGDVEVELGLFSVESVDLAGPFLSVLEGLSSAAGVSFINVALPFVGPLLQGVNLLAGTQGNTILEIGLASTFDKPTTGYFLIMRAPKGTVNTANLRVQSGGFGLVDATGQPLAQYPYMVISIEASTRREDWFQIPELGTTYNDLKQAIIKGSIQSVKEAQTVFNRTTLTCPDLITDDAQKLVEKVAADVKRVETTLTGAGKVSFPDLRDIKLYG